MSPDPQSPSFEAVKDRLDEIVAAVSDESISLDEALDLYEEAVTLGLSACEVSADAVIEAAGRAEGGSPDAGDGAPAAASVDRSADVAAADTSADAAVDAPDAPTSPVSG